LEDADDDESSDGEIFEPTATNLSQIIEKDITLTNSNNLKSIGT